MNPKSSSRCPNCGKMGIVCTYLGDCGAIDYEFTWEHRCSYCNYFERFVETCDADADNIPDPNCKRGPGKKGGCPGHKEIACD